ncbi:MAG: O-antigen ligase family protein [Chloroflexota bacterium]
MESSKSPDKLMRFLWAAALLCLPVTSFRWFPGLGETTYMRPLAFFPLALLLPLLLVKLARKRIQSPFPGGVIVLLAFGLALAAATVFGALEAPLSLRGQTYWGRAVRAWATLAIGLTFFVSAAWMNKDEADLRFSVRFLLAGFGLDILWSAVQALAFYTPLLDKVTVTHWQLAFSMRELVKTNRVSGLAYEPAWLAGQIATVYLPWLFGAVLTGIHLTRFRWLEALLLAASGLLVLATYSRGGLVTALGAVALTFLLAGGQVMRDGWRWFLAGFRNSGSSICSWVAGAGLRLGLIALAALTLLGAGVILGQKGYMTRLWNTQAESLTDFVIENSAGARAAYTWGALGAYDRSPWLGVGLGASGFYIYQNLPDWALTTVPEIARQLSPANRLYPNPKNLYVRILAESGLLGLSLFAAFWLGLLGDALGFLRKDGWLRFLGVAGLCSWLAVSFYNLTQDSFATPNMWVNLGLLVGMTRLTLSPGNSLEERS